MVLVFRLFLDPRFLLAFMIAPFIAWAGEAMAYHVLADHFTAHHPWTLAEYLWPHVRGHGETLVSVWVMPGLVFTYIATFVSGLPVLIFMVFRRHVSLCRFVIAGAVTAFCFKSLIIIGYVSLLLTSSNQIRTFILDLENLLKLLDWLGPMLFSASLYGFLVGVVFWLVAVWQNPTMPSRNGSTLRLTPRT